MMTRKAGRALALVVALVLLVLPGTAAQALAAAPRSGELVGNDVSWPQCGDTLPTGQAFAIVGVNNGRANTTNPCLREQLAWARTSTGATNQPRVALYVNTANPGLAGAWWPTSNVYPGGAPSVPNPYGQCDGTGSAACAYVYGYAKAYDNATIRGVANPEQYFWWLDVETMNTWQADKVANRAVLEGMTYYYSKVLRAAGVGIYSTSLQWTIIVGGVGRTTSGTVEPGPSILNGLPSWIAGATTLTGAKRNCDSTPLTGGTVAVTQYVSGDLDYNFACV